MKINSVIHGLTVIVIFLSIGCARSDTATSPAPESGLVGSAGDPVIAIWWDDHGHHPDAGYRLYFCAWPDGFVLEARERPGIGIRAFQIDPEVITTSIAEVEQLGFFDRQPLSQIDLAGYSVVAVRGGGRSNAYVLNQPPTQMVCSEFDDYRELWNGVFAIVDAIELPVERQVELDALFEGSGTFRGFCSRLRRATWMSTIVDRWRTSEYQSE